MNVKITRREALELFGYLSMLDLTVAARESILIDVFSEDDEFEKISDFNDPVYNSQASGYLRRKNKGVTNQYLSVFLGRRLERNIDVEGEQVFLNPCPCCTYMTLDGRGEYDICPVCFWEDDGSVQDERYSPANRITLAEARSNFLKFGAKDEPSIKFIDDQGKLKYPRKV